MNPLVRKCGMPRWRGWVAPASVACLLAASAAQARTIEVPGTYVTIQEAIDVAVAGDEIHVAPGRYVESIDPGGKAIRIFATEGPRSTFLDGTEQRNSVIRCVSGEGADTIIEGFRVVSGTGDPSFYGPEATIGGGIVVMGSSPVIRNCVIEGNSASYNGGGMFNGSGSDVKLDGCRFVKNAAEKGGAIFNIESSPQILRCEFESNSARYAGGGIYNANQSDASHQGLQFHAQSRDLQRRCNLQLRQHSEDLQLCVLQQCRHLQGWGDLPRVPQRHADRGWDQPVPDRQRRHRRWWLPDECRPSQGGLLHRWSLHRGRGGPVRQGGRLLGRCQHDLQGYPRQLLSQASGRGHEPGRPRGYQRHGDPHERLGCHASRLNQPSPPLNNLSVRKWLRANTRVIAFSTMFRARAGARGDP